jgi:hypothetical protein
MKEQRNPQAAQDEKTQFKVRTDLRAGESVEACLNNLNYWRNAYYTACGQPVPTPYIA